MRPLLECPQKGINGHLLRARAATGDDDTNVSYAALGSLRRTIGELEKLSGKTCVVDMELITARGHVPEPPSPPRL